MPIREDRLFSDLGFLEWLTRLRKKCAFRMTESVGSRRLLCAWRDVEAPCCSGVVCGPATLALLGSLLEENHGSHPRLCQNLHFGQIPRWFQSSCPQPWLQGFKNQMPRLPTSHGNQISRPRWILILLRSSLGVLCAARVENLWFRAASRPFGVVVLCDLEPATL